VLHPADKLMQAQAGRRIGSRASFKRLSLSVDVMVSLYDSVERYPVQPC